MQEETTAAGPRRGRPEEEGTGLMDEILSALPDGARVYAERYGREALAALSLCLLGVILWAGFSTYRQRQEDRAAALVGQALVEREPGRRAGVLERLEARCPGTDAGRQGLLLLAGALREQGMDEKAREAFEKAARVYDADHPLGAAARMGLAGLAEAGGRPAAARRRYREVVEAEVPGFGEVALLDLARLEAAAGDVEAARRHYQAFLESGGDGTALRDFARYRLATLPGGGVEAGDRGATPGS
ncbi:tetratricopeptide repeat protein [Dissulfurirhabdus thermomarina]|uniref:Tetratricopeptide repeat protein n=1 Tax=Dissulfurirhabdus thermomarina TaxID=1765737 RepID=A0A6N9TJM1_DISTH|nr:tetratricopeptide repeat protein [Dissulfurirhabdus thermomarina]NDY41279.1 tetratricopeptide repeat protein [Dissulfurirhabdus thermomarina]NMX23736.1 tetratricopeptide repeat protein [Dissulfurirhabdus thermomarina]